MSSRTLLSSRFLVSGSASVLLGGAGLLLATACVARRPRPDPTPDLAARAAEASAPRAGAEPARSPGVEGARSLGDPYYPGSGNAGYDVRHYDLRLDLDFASGAIEAEARLGAVAIEDLASFSLDLHGLEVLEVEVDGRAAPFEREVDELVVRPPGGLLGGEPFVCLVRYAGVPDVIPDPAIPFIPGVGWMHASDGIHVLSEVVGARTWFPCNDHPLDKASFTIAVTVDEPLVAAANGRLVEEIDHGDRRTFRFSAPDPMATYLATLNVGLFERREETTPRGLPLVLYYPAEAPEEDLAAFARTAEMIERFEQLFGPYPFESFGGVLAHRQLGGALETQTLPVYGRGTREEVVAHELAHQWFGNCVSVDLWRDLWLSEGFATYASWLWLEHLEGPEALASRALGMHRRLWERKVGPPADPGVEQLFGPRTYSRGALVLHALRGEMGDEAFFALLREWVASHNDGNASTQHFLELASRVAGRDLGPFFDTWLLAEVLPAPPDEAKGAEGG